MRGERQGLALPMQLTRLELLTGVYNDLDFEQAEVGETGPRPKV